jgi:hypothetical protein
MKADKDGANRLHCRQPRAFAGHRFSLIRTSSRVWARSDPSSLAFSYQCLAFLDPKKNQSFLSVTGVKGRAKHQGGTSASGLGRALQDEPCAGDADDNAFFPPPYKHFDHLGICAGRS